MGNTNWFHVHKSLPTQDFPVTICATTQGAHQLAMMLHGLKTLPPEVAHLVRMLDAELIHGPESTVAYAKKHKKDAEEHQLCLMEHQSTASTAPESTNPPRTIPVAAAVAGPQAFWVECRNPTCEYGGLKTHSHPL